MNLTNLHTFRVVATTLSFSQAAELLDYAQSSVSAQIQALEGELGKPLFDRRGRHVALTAAGRQLLGYAEQLLALSAEARAAIGSDQPITDYLRIGAPETVLTHRLPALLRAFTARHPGVQVAFGIQLDSDLYRQVLSGELDLAFLLQLPVSSPSLNTLQIYAEPMVVLAANDHRLTQLSKVGPQDLAGETLLLTERGCGYRHLFEHAAARAGSYAYRVLELSSVEAIRRCVAAGLGIGFLPRVVAQDGLERGELAELAWESRWAISTQLVWQRQRTLSPAQQAFIALCREQLGDS